jgi:ketol-acid reductoisomerase
VAEMFYDDDADLSVVQGRHVAVLGYGSQGHAHSLSLRDSGVDVRVGLPEGSKSRAKAEAEGLRVLTPYEACEEADLIMILAPDPVQRTLYKEAVEPNLVEGDALFFGHGFNIRFGYIKPPAGVDVCMVAPKGPGHLVRREFSEGRGVPVLVAVEEDASGKAWDLALSYAKGIGGLRAGGIRTTFTEETDTAEYGDYVSGPRVIDAHVKENMQQILAEIQDGTFAQRFIDDQDKGAPEFKALRAKAEQHPIEQTGRELRKLMAWVKSHDDDYTEGTATRS